MSIRYVNWTRDMLMFSEKSKTIAKIAFEKNTRTIGFREFQEKKKKTSRILSTYRVRYRTIL